MASSFSDENEEKAKLGLLLLILVMMGKPPDFSFHCFVNIRRFLKLFIDEP
jgi:hypothetical protein